MVIAILQALNGGPVRIGGMACLWVVINSTLNLQEAKRKGWMQDLHQHLHVAGKQEIFSFLIPFPHLFPFPPANSTLRGPSNVPCTWNAISWAPPTCEDKKPSIGLLPVFLPALSVLVSSHHHGPPRLFARLQSFACADSILGATRSARYGLTSGVSILRCSGGLPPFLTSTIKENPTPTGSSSNGVTF